MRRRRSTLLVPALAAAVLVSGTPAALAASPQPAPAAPQTPPAPDAEPVPAREPTPPGPLKDDTAGAEKQGPVTADAPDGTAVVEVVRGRWTRAGDLPLLVSGVDGRSPRKVRLTFSTGADVTDRGAAAIVLAERMDGSSRPAKVRLRVETAPLAQHFRANWVHRLKVATLPACAAHGHPHGDRGKHKGHAYAFGKGKHCPAAELVDDPITDDPGDGNLDFDATAGAPEEATEEDPEGGEAAPAFSARATTSTSTSAGTAYAVSAGPSGSAGTFTATSLAPSTSWQVGEQAGNFSTSYTVPLPPSPAGSSPGVTLSYSSQSVDGRTSGSNNQASWAGMGWDYEPGSVQRQYGGCADDGHRGIGDLCWKNANAVLSLGGSSIPLYKGANGLWHPAQDSGLRVQLLTGASNGAHSGQYWVVTQTDGTKYWFGLGHQPTTGAATRSAWTVPVYGDDAGEPCHRSSFSTSSCMQPWRWNLDRVVDRNGNVTTYFYAPETNRYGRLGSPSLETTYTRGGVLTRIDYGQRSGDEDSPAPARVLFTAPYRCSALTSSCPAPNEDNGEAFPDVPNDLICADTYCSGQLSPVFFDTRRLATVTTYVRGSSGYAAVDAVALTHSFPSPGDGSDATLWLKGITRTGFSRGVKTTLPPVLFGGTRLPNRVDYSAALGVVPLNMFRLGSIRGEMGATTKVVYGRPHPCDKSALPSAAYNTKNCYPHYWVPQYGPAGFGWFHKYVVSSVSVDESVAQQPTTLTRYSYGGTPAWHHDEDPVSPSSKQSWGQWRGYARTTVTTGTAVPGITSSLWFRGMNGDSLPGGKKRTATVTDSTGTSVTDGNWLAGALRERRQLTPGGTELAGSVTGYFVKTTVNGAGLADAVVVRPSRVDGRTRVQDPAGGAASTRRTRSTTTYDNVYTQPVSVLDSGDLATTSDDVCTTTTYARNTSTWLLDLPGTQAVRASTCASTSPLLGQVHHFYDGHLHVGDVPAKGNETLTQAFDTATTRVSTKASYDARGRVRSSTNGNNHTTATGITELYPNGPVTQVTVTDALSRKVVTKLDPSRGLPTSTVDPNNHTTTLRYDALGRLTGAWQPTEPLSGPASASFAYKVQQTAPSYVLSHTLQDDSVTLHSASYLDGLGRTVATAAPASSGRAVVLTRYDDRGQVAGVSDPLNTSGTYSSGLPVIAPGSIPRESRSSYDTLGRPTTTSRFALGALTSQTRTAYFGGAVVTTPAEGTATRTYVDAQGRTRRIVQILDGRLLTTSYSYDRLGQLKTVTDTGKNVATFTYDMLGRQRSADLPDSGLTSTTYNGVGNPVAVTDATNKTVVTTYDALERPYERREDSTTGNRLAAWRYDQPGYLGLPHRSFSYDGANAFVSSVDGYDARNRPTSRSLTVPASEGQLAGTWTTGLHYDAADHVTQVDLPAVGDLPAETLTSTYDGLGQPDATTGSSAEGTTTYVSGTEYDDTGRLVQRDLGSWQRAVHRNYDYDPATGHLWVLRAWSPFDAGPQNDLGQLQRDEFRYDKAGQVLQVTDHVTGQRQCNAYDDVHRLVHAWTSDVDCSDEAAPHHAFGPVPYDWKYRLADTGQLLSRTSGISGVPAQTYSYPAPGAGVKQPHGVTSTGGQTFDYDTNGELKTRAGGDLPLSLEWTAVHTIATATTPTGTDSYVYDTGGRRILRRSPTESVLTLDGAELTLKAGVLTARRYITSGGATVAVRDASGITWMLGDRQGSLAVAVNARTLGSQRQLYGPYGETRQREQTVTDRGFLGKPHDKSTGLDVLDHRSYDHDLGRLLSPDPVYQPFNPASFDAYGYASSNPTTFSDPTGLMTDEVQMRTERAPSAYDEREVRKYIALRARLDAIDAAFEAQQEPGFFSVDTLQVAGRGFSNFSTSFANTFTSAVGVHLDTPYKDSIYRYSSMSGTVTGYGVQLLSGGAAVVRGAAAVRSAVAGKGLLGAAGDALSRAGNALRQLPQLLRAGKAAEGGGGLGSRLRSINWADDTGSITLPGRSEPKLIYEANPKHGTVSRPGPRGEVSRAPRGDCQAMLECSTQIGPRLREGVEPDSGLPVVFRQHREFEGTEWWHGYVPGG